MKMRPLGAELFLADGYTGRHNETKIHFSQFCETNASKVEVISKTI